MLLKSLDAISKSVNEPTLFTVKFEKEEVDV